MAEASTDTKRSDKCAHESCACSVEPGVAYCSEHCAQVSRNASTSSQHGQCGCGHPACN